ncbi:MAG: hypothetical protein P4M13_03475 [Alphaproteobacteria bacterium]|nr:hypothetical protein [Alphaproteobacteria bacterium]
MFLFLYFGLPRLIPPLPEHHGPIPIDIVTIGDITNTRVGESKEEKASSPPPAPQTPPKAQPAPPPPPPQEKPQPPAPPPPEAKPEPQAEALKPVAVPKPQEKPKPPAEKPVAAKPQPDMLASVLKNVAKMKPVEAPPNAEAKPDAKPAPQTQSGTAAGTGSSSSFGSRLMITEEDALRRQIEQCWNPPIGARDAQNLIVEVVIDVNQDRTVADADIVDKMRYASDPFFRAAADAAVRAVRNPRCSPLILPEGKYDEWKRIDFTFDPRDML